MIDLSSPFAPFLLMAYAISLINISQGIFLLYKYFNGYGAIFPWEQIKKSFTGDGRYVSTVPSLVVSPDKTTKNQRYVLLFYSLMMFLSVFIVWQIAQSIK